LNQFGALFQKLEKGRKIKELKKIVNRPKLGRPAKEAQPASPFNPPALSLYFSWKMIPIGQWRSLEENNGRAKQAKREHLFPSMISPYSKLVVITQCFCSHWLKIL
jgi:hypothetical protein